VVPWRLITRWERIGPLVSDKPILHALVAYFSPAFGLCSDPRIMPLEEALDFLRAGFVVLVDPGDEEDLVRWEQIQRSRTSRRRWLDV